MKGRIQVIRRLVQVLFFLGLVTTVIPGFMNIWSLLLIAIFFMTILFGNFYCGWICPFGTLQEWIGWLGGKLGIKKIKMPYWLEKYLKFSKYFIYGIMLLNGVAGITNLTETSAFNGNYAFMQLATVMQMDFMQRSISAIAVVILILYVVLSLFVDRPFCHYICPDGIKYSLTSFLRIFSIKRDEGICVGCKKCNHICPMNINISDAGKVRNANCINCMKCVDVCPVKDALSYKV